MRIDRFILADLIALAMQPEFISVEAHYDVVFHHLVASVYGSFKIVEGKYVHYPCF